MAGVPGFISDLGWWALVPFLFVVVFVRTQATYWLGRWARTGASRLAESPSEKFLARASRRLDGPMMARGEAVLDRWGYVAIPLSFLTLGFQTVINATAGYVKMRWGLYTLVMLPGCALWTAAYTIVGASIVHLWQHSPTLAIAFVVGVVAVAWAATRVTRIVRQRRSAGSAARTPR
ncbi:DedA family protein [Demequina sp. NBRC 110057]|uniref:DedA family protein n=1 Tax=Demequina sp. NBRC 110057 TaxID=1570346 RepID=UPI000A00A479|nr:VTT domain-containing protein [Demequina sp. NBRC 110057]